MKKKIYGLSLIFFLIDIISKVLIKNLVTNKITVIKDFFYIDKMSNKGAAFSILEGKNIIFIIIAILLLIYINKYLNKEKETKLNIIGYSLLIGGILGNLLDRILYREVLDFLSFKIINYMTPVFNLADIMICTGVFILIISFIKGEKDGNRSNK